MAEPEHSGGGQSASVWKCTNTECGGEFPSGVPGMHFCSRCGAKLSLNLLVNVQEGTPTPGSLSPDAHEKTGEQKRGAQLADPNLRERESPTTAVHSTQSGNLNDTFHEEQQATCGDRQRNPADDATPSPSLAQSEDDNALPIQQTTTQVVARNDKPLDHQPTTVGGGNPPHKEQQASPGHSEQSQNNSETEGTISNPSSTLLEDEKKDEDTFPAQKTDTGSLGSVNEAGNNSKTRSTTAGAGVTGIANQDAPKLELQQVFGDKQDSDANAEVKTKQEKKHKEERNENQWSERKERRRVEVEKTAEQKAKTMKEKEEERKREHQEKEEVRKQQRENKRKGSVNTQAPSITTSETDPLQEKENDRNRHRVAGGSKSGNGAGSQGDISGKTQKKPYMKPPKPDELFSGTGKRQPIQCSEGQEPKKTANVQSTTQEKQKRKYNYREHPSPTWDLDGLKAKNSIAVTFHCIVYKLLWEWDEASSIHMRFEGSALGDWKQNVGVFQHGRQLEEGVFEMMCTLRIDANLLKYPWGYKYVVYSPKMVEKYDCFEHLHSFVGRLSHRNPNRCLKINPSDLIRDELHQFDFFVYPKVTTVPKSLATRAWEAGKGFLKSFFTSDSEEKERFTIPSTEVMMKRCLHFYLEPFKCTLLGNKEYPQTFSIGEFGKHIKNVFEQHSKPVVQHNDSPYHVSVDIKVAFQEWLEDVVDNLQFVENPKRQFISSVCIVYCLEECHFVQPKEAKFLYPLLKMLQVQPNMRDRSCPNVAYIFDATNDKSRSTLAQAVFKLCRQTMKLIKRDEKLEWLSVWLSVLPLCHFLSGSCKLYDSIEFYPRKEHFYARVNAYDYQELRQRILPGFVVHFYKLEPLFLADPLLLYDFIYLCPEEDYSCLFEKIPAFLSVTWLCFNKLPSYPSEVEKWKQLLEIVKKKMLDESIEEQLSVATVDAATRLVTQIFNELTGEVKQKIDVLKRALSLVLHSLCQIEFLADQNKAVVNKITDVLGMCQVALQDWLKKVTFGNHFGGRIHRNNNYYFVYGSIEFRIWQNLLSLEVPKFHRVECTWNGCIEKVIKQRVERVPEFMKIELVNLLDIYGHEDDHPMLATALMEAAMEAVDRVSHYDVLHSHGESPRYGLLLGHILVKKYPQLTEGLISISLDDILNWPYWPDFIKLYNGSSKAKQGLSEKCLLACTCAASQLELVSQQICVGDVTLTNIEKIIARLEQIKRLSDAAKKADNSKEHPDLYQTVLRRLQEFQVYRDQKIYLENVCQKLDHTIEGVRDAEEEVKKDFKAFKMNSVCSRGDSGKISVICFTIAAPLISFAEMFYTMTKTLNSDILFSLWSVNMNKARESHPDLSVSDVESKIWSPTITQCQKLLNELQGLSMTLSDVDEHFKGYELNDIKKELTQLLIGIHKYFPQYSLDGDDWIHDIICRIEDYKKLCNYRHAANYFLEIRKSLELQGNFRDVERISQKVSSSMKDQTLAEINTGLVKAGEFLSHFTGENLECLHKFCKSKNIVNWIRETTKDVGDLQNFVSVALTTAAGGEDDYANDRLSNLRTVGSGFSSLIYKLEPDTGFEELCKRCESVWAAYKDNRKLPRMLASCNDDLEWYKSVKETQGSVEVTSFGQMENILSFGCYTVGGRREIAMDSVHDVIRLTLVPQTGVKLLKAHYSLDELRDLESKLVLITGSKAENRAAVEHFLDTLHCVCRIAEVLIRLQQVGNVQYIGWRMEFYCEPRLVEDLQNQAKRMEAELDEWNKTVTLARNKFYELNYYTTRQLLILRSELGKIKSLGLESRQQYLGQVMTLLESLSCEITPTNLKRVVNLMSFEHDVDKREASPSTMVQKKHQPVLSILPPRLSPLSQVAPTEHHVGKLEHMPGLPLVSLSREKLTNKQKENCVSIIEKFSYSEMTALKAIEAVGDGDWNDIKNWLDENADEFEAELQEYEEEESEGEDMHDEDEVETSEEESDEEMREKNNINMVAHSQAHDPSLKSRIMVTYRPQIDETNEEVQKLLDAGMGSTEECIRAIEMHGTAYIATNHMMEMELVEEDEVLFQGAPVQRTVKVYPCQYNIKPDIISISLGSVENQYLKLKELGAVLRKLSSDFPSTVKTARKRCVLKPGQPHLLVVPPEQVLRAALSLYMEDGDLPMPTPEEMFICSKLTTTEEVNLLWQRAVFDPDFKRIFCLVHAEKLSYQTADKTLRTLSEIIQNRRGYRLVIICSSQDEEKTPIISKLHLHRRPFVVSPDINKYRAYLRKHFVDEHQPQLQQAMGSVPNLKASVVDNEGSCVRVVSSTRAGMGKTLFITRMAEILQSAVPEGHKVIITIPVHGPVVTVDSVMQSLVKHQNSADCIILHFDILPSVLWQMDTVLFSLLILRSLCDTQGRVWRNRSTQLYAIEVTLPESNEQQVIPEQFTLSVLDMLPSTNAIKPKTVQSLMSHEVQDNKSILMDKNEFESDAFQRVYQYLRRHATNLNLDRFTYNKGTVEGTPYNCLQIVLSYCGVKDPSWAEVRHFVKFLDLQLQACEHSYFCDEKFVGDVMRGFKSFVVKFMIRMSTDFSTSSLRGAVAQENEEDVQVQADDTLAQYQIVERKQWEQSSHPYLFFNQDRISITFVGFTVTRNGDLCDPSHRGTILERGIMDRQLYTGLSAQQVNFDEDHRRWSKEMMIRKILTVMGIDESHDPDPTYVLTVDNLIKILAIQMRFRCGIPVVIMGETGCGKTRLIRFMCDLMAQERNRGNMLTLKVHGGTSEKNILDFLQNAEKKAEENRENNLDTVVFFDEANTTEAIGLIKEIMCDRRAHGHPISQDLKFIAACNPYRRHSEEMIEKLHSAGLGFYVREADTQQKLGKIPLRELVYRVIDLPPSMRPLVYDFGQLNTDTERDYTRQIVHDHVMKHDTLSRQHKNIIPAVAEILAWSQKYMRKREDECSFVSLRDVERAMLVFIYFFEKRDLLRDAIDVKENKEYGTEVETQDDGEEPLVAAPVASFNDLTRSLILAVNVCYHARLTDRKEYEEGVSKMFTAPLTLTRRVDEFRNVIRWCQEVLLESMVLGENIAHNAALRENVFMMAVCVDLRIPLFLVGKPGSSKSLAKAIIADSMKGHASHNDLLKSFKEVHMFSYQCSQLSTPQSVIEVFNTAKKFQKDQDTTKYVSVVVLDEVGLAEDSPNLPLKALHPLLEDGTEGADENDEIVTREKRVSFIGISNWALDPAKMNRGVMVTRGDPDINELVVSAQGICHNEENNAVQTRLSVYFRHLAEAYHQICRKQKRQFFGLRDFYSLIKMLYWMCEKTNKPPTGPQLVHAIKRNFGGLKEDDVDPEIVFWEWLPRDIALAPDLSNVSEDIHPFVNPDNTPRGLIKTSLKTKETSWHGENRYLLFLTENYAALEILKQYLQDLEGQQLFHGINPEESTLKPWEMEPFVLFGSSFPRDKEYTQVCRNINQIKICMEIGRTVILLNLENLYESLYDVLNQYYIHSGGNRYVDLGLQTHKVKCRVHDEFKLILIAEKTTVYEEFPTPLINRLEKHFVLYSSVLEDWQTATLENVGKWIKQFSHVRTSNSVFKEKEAFVGYQNDVAAAVVFQASSQLRKVQKRYRGEDPTIRRQLWESAWEGGLLGDFKLEELVSEVEGSEKWKLAVMLISQFLLLQTAPPPALIRLNKTELECQYKRLTHLYQSQHHGSIDDFLNHHLAHDTSRGGLLMQVTTHSHLLSSDEVDELQSLLEELGKLLDVHSFLLQEFDTELDFTSKVSPLFIHEAPEKACLLIIQCDSGHINGDLIACARYRIYDMRAKALLNWSQHTHNTHVLFIINLPVQVVVSSFVGFQGDPWISCHIDELRPSEKGAITLEGAQGVAVSQLFYGGIELAERQMPEYERQESDFTRNVEGMVFERMRSAENEEQEEEEEKDDKEETKVEHVEREGEEGSEEGEDEEEIQEGEEEEIQEGEEEEEIQEGEEEEEIQEGEEKDKMLVMDIEDEESALSTSDSTGTSEEIMRSEQSVGSMRSPSPDSHTALKEESVNAVFQQTKTCSDISDMYTQCVRLNSCIQAAASRLQDSVVNKQRAAERVRLLIDVIPRNPVFPLELDSFYTILVSHILRMLRERENVRQDDDWILEEAMDMNHLQTGGTFKNVLTRKLDEIVVPCLAEIIAFMDRNCNLNLLQTVCPITPLTKFWLMMFGSQRSKDALCFADMVGRQKVPMRDEEFVCEFPFSWLVKELMDSQWDNAQATGGQDVHRQLCGLVSGTILGEILLSVQDGGECEELYRRYLHDFVRSVHKCPHKTEATVKLEYQLIRDSLHNMIVRSDIFSSLDGNVSLVSRIAAVHVVYRASSECIHWFSQLTSHYAGIMNGLLQSVGEDECMMLHLYAVDKVLTSNLKPPLDAKRESQFGDDKSLRAWLKSLREISIAVDSTLNISSEHPIACKARLQWQKIRAIKMFTEHVLLNDVSMIVYARRLDLSLDEEADFATCSTIEKVKRMLNSMHNKLKRELSKKKDGKKQLAVIRKSCRNFFLEVVSGLCFGQANAPDDDLVQMLLNIVFTEGEQESGAEGEKWGTRELTPYKDDLKEKDATPTIRSFLLQLLLEHNMEKVRIHLKTYFDRGQQALMGRVGIDQDLCLLCTQCIEDAIYKEFCSHSLGSRMKAVLKRKMLSSATDILTRSAGFTERTISLEILESIAKMRYALLVVSELLHLQVNEREREEDDHSLYGRIASILIDEAKHACIDSRINVIDTTGNGNTTGPAVYLLKLLVRQSGFACLKDIVQMHNWVIPQELRRDEEEKTWDPFVIYTSAYSCIRKEMSDAAYGREYDDLQKHTAALESKECVPLVLSVYKVYTMSRASIQNSRHLLPETMEKMNDMIVNSSALQRELKIMARALVSNEQGGPLAALQVSTGQPSICRTLGALVVHVAATLFTRSSDNLLSPLVNLLTAPGNMAQCYLPTMGEDILPQVKDVMKDGQFYECPNGHPYFIGECGKPWVESACNVCGSVIGGVRHKKATNNRDARTTDNTETGYALGHPTTRGNVPTPERSLTPAACCIVRVIMHSALLWTSCNNDTATEGLLALVRLRLRSPQELPEFFWGHLERDVQLLGRALGKNLDEAAIVVHLTLKNINNINSTGTGLKSTLASRSDRDQWEKQFSLSYIHPILEKLEAELSGAMEAILNDDTQDHDPLYYLVYERMPVVEGSLEPHLWCYRPRITLEYLTRYMQQQKKTFKILKEFLQNEAVLRATQYLPDIVRLQRRMFDEFHHRIDSKVARAKTMRDFIHSRHTENERNEYQKLLASLSNAWSLVREKLDYGQLKVKDEYLQQDLKLDTTLDYFIPTTTGPGACTFALVHYLACAHNNFMEFCRARNKSSWSHEYKIQLPHIHACHLLDYQSQLQSIILSHCHYSLRVGQGHEVSYDLPALEKHILDRFIHGKPTILIDIPHVSYQKDVYTAATFEAVRKKVAPQVDLQPRVQMDILRELATPDKLRKCLDVVEIVLGFLTSGGGKPTLRLRSYLKRLKMERKAFSEKAKEHCNLEHILSLWQTLSVGLARIIALSGQEPFHTLNHELLEQLTDTQCQNLDGALTKFDLPALLGTLYEFIETYVRHIDMGKKEWGLLEVLPEMSNLKVPAELDELPDDITLAQTVALWKYIVEFQSHQK